jgi:curli biogenesis system outer membrane secretion channel CsgG
LSPGRVPERGRSSWLAVAVALALVSMLAGACAPAALPADDPGVRPYQLEPATGEDRYVVAVYDIEADPTRVDASLLPASERDERFYVDLGHGVADVVMRELYELDRFDLVERRNLAAIMAEQDLGSSDRFDASTVAEIGRLSGAELVVVGAVTEFAIDRAGAALPGFLGGASVTTVVVSVELRVVDVATGRILGLGSGRGSGRDAEVSVTALQQAIRLLRVGTVRQSLVGTALRNAIREAVENAVTRLPPRNTAG